LAFINWLTVTHPTPGIPYRKKYAPTHCLERLEQFGEILGRALDLSGFLSSAFDKTLL
jgi:hypothetical protein